MKKIFTLLALIGLCGSAVAAQSSSFVSCVGKVSKNSDGTTVLMEDSSIEILPYKKQGPDVLDGEVDWMAKVTTGDGEYILKPVTYRYSLVRQTITFNFKNETRTLEFGLNLDDSARVGTQHSGGFGLTLKGSTNSVSLVGLKMACSISKHIID